MTRHTFSRFVPDGCKFVRTGITWTEIARSPTINFGGRKFTCWTPIYERWGLSTNRAWPNACQVEYMGSSLRIKWDTWSCLSQCTTISNLSTKFRSWTWITLRSFLNFLYLRRNHAKKVVRSYRTSWDLQISKMEVKRYTESTNIAWFKRAGELLDKPIAAHPYELSSRVSIRIGQAWNESYPIISSFLVIVWFNVIAQTVHEVNIMVVQL